MRHEIPDDSSFEDSHAEHTQSESARAELERTARDLGLRLAHQNESGVSENPLNQTNFGADNFDDDDVFEDDAAALRWRRALLRLSETFLDAAEERRDLSPILLGALHNALEQLLIHGEEDDLMALEDWLSHEAPLSDEEGSTPFAEHSGDFLIGGTKQIYAGQENRVGDDRRSRLERRQAERRHQQLPGNSPGP